MSHPDRQTAKHNVALIASIVAISAEAWVRNRSLRCLAVCRLKLLGTSARKILLAMAQPLETFSKEPLRRCLLELERRMCSAAFLQVAAFAPTACQYNTYNRIGIVAAILRENYNSIGASHFLIKHLDQPTHPTHKASSDPAAWRLFWGEFGEEPVDQDIIFCLGPAEPRLLLLAPRSL